MTEEYWAAYKKKKDLTNQNVLFKTMENELKVKQVKN